MISEDLGKLLQFKDLSLESLVDDFIKLAAVERLLERIVMRAIDINEHLIAELSTGQEEKIARLTYKDTFLKLAELGIYSSEFAEKISKSVGLRNILVHDYNDTDYRIVHSSIKACLKDYQIYVDRINDYLESR